MKKNNIPTAEEFFKKYSNLYQFEEGEPEYLVDKEDFKSALIESNKLHVKAALEAATAIPVKSDPILNYLGYLSHYHYTVDKDSILNAYPETNIK